MLALHTPGQEGHIVCCHHCSSVVSVGKLRTFHPSCWKKKGQIEIFLEQSCTIQSVFFVSLKFQIANTIAHKFRRRTMLEYLKKKKNPFLETENGLNPICTWMDGPLQSLSVFFSTTATLKFKIEISSVHTSIKKPYINRWAVEGHESLWLHCFNYILIFVLCCLCILNSFCRILLSFFILT